jgi:hypothetical protein
MAASVTPEQALRAHLAGTSGRGTFESHITTEVTDPAQAQRFRQLCQDIGVKCVLIELPEGVVRSQPMTACYHHGDIAEVIQDLERLCSAVRAAGFPLTRVKLEAVATNEGVPDLDEEAAHLPPGRYFEFHVKLLLSPDDDLETLRTCCARHTARLSRNALKSDRHGGSERFVTLRRYGVGRQAAFAALEALESDLQAAGFTIAHRQREYTLFDSAERLDAGWLDPPSGREAPS